MEEFHTQGTGILNQLIHILNLLLTLYSRPSLVEVH